MGKLPYLCFLLLCEILLLETVASSDEEMESSAVPHRRQKRMLEDEIDHRMNSPDHPWRLTSLGKHPQDLRDIFTHMPTEVKITEKIEENITDRENVARTVVKTVTKTAYAIHPYLVVAPTARFPRLTNENTKPFQVDSLGLPNRPDNISKIRHVFRNDQVGVMVIEVDAPIVLRTGPRNAMYHPQSGYPFVGVGWADAQAQRIIMERLGHPHDPILR